MMCNANCINTAKIDKNICDRIIILSDFIFHQIKQLQKCFDHEKDETMVTKFHEY